MDHELLIRCRDIAWFNAFRRYPSDPLPSVASLKGKPEVTPWFSAFRWHASSWSLDHTLGNVFWKKELVQKPIDLQQTISVQNK
jgi:hypothetical protein